MNDTDLKILFATLKGLDDADYKATSWKLNKLENDDFELCIGLKRKKKVSTWVK